MSTSPAVRLVTCAHLPELAPDDQELLHALRRKGIDVEVAVWDDPTVDWAAAPVTVIRSVFDYHLRPAEFLAWLADIESKTTVHNAPEIIKWNAHKSYLRGVAEAGFDIIPTHWLSRDESVDIATIRARNSWTDIVVKPAISASAHRTLKVTGDNLAEGQAHAEDLLRDGDALVQPYLYDFETTGETSVIWLGPRQTHSVRRPSGIHTTLEEAHVGAPLTPSESEIALAGKVYDWITPKPLYARIDIIDSVDYGLLVLELELIEPALYLRHSTAVADAFADAVIDLIER
ncbi:ATP-grasp domain-containing protein [Actinokineospora sp.]|uniref:ATP-grasp domain-containing protein n=1 Tax=Actinokineospora sp. TaxID=1872133 RepID=UPI004037E7F3